MREQGSLVLEATLRVHRRDGVFKRELATQSGHLFFEPLVIDDVVFVAVGSEISRFAFDGTRLERFAYALGVTHLSPGPAGGVLAANSHGEIFQFAADGKPQITFRQIGASSGIDLARDGCTVYYGTLARWSVCLESEPVWIAHLGHASQSIRVLPDGTLLASVFMDNGWGVLHLDRAGSVIRQYLLADNYGVALDLDGTSFWANDGDDLLRIDIATGTVLSRTDVGFSIYGISVVGERRAGFAMTSIPAASPIALLALSVAIAALALFKLRMS